MATVADQQRIKSSRTMAGGLLWAAIVLGLLTWWLGAKYWNTDSTFTVVLSGALAVLALGLSGAAFLRPVSKKLLGAAFLLGGAALVLVGVWLIIQEGLSAFGEFAGAIVMALIAFGRGLAQLHPPEGPTIQERFVRTLVGSLPTARVGALVLAAIFIGGGVWLILSQGWLVIYPEATGLFFLAVIFLGAGIWLASATPENATPTRLRILVLLVGGLTGLVITLATVLRILVWWTPVFAAGVRVWQGSAAWQVWVCVYAGLAGLAIMFGSLLLARADVRTNVVLRRLLYGYNTILTGLLLLAILVVLNVVVYVSYPYTFDWTQTRGIHTLSPSSKNLLESLKEPAKIYVLMPANSLLYPDVRQLLENARAYSDKLDVQYISPERDPNAYRELAIKYPDLVREGRIDRGEESEGGRGLLVVYGPESAKKPLHTFIPERDLRETKGPTMPGERKATLFFKGEDVVMTQLRFLENNQSKPKVYFTQGNGELDITEARPVLTVSAQEIVPSAAGDGRLVDRLKKDNYEVRGLVWSAPPKKSTPGDLVSYAKKDAASPDAVPEDAKIVVIAGPRRPFSRSALEALERYLQGGGKMIFLGRAIFQRVNDAVVYKPTGLEDLLKKFNVDLQADYILSLPGRTEFGPLGVMVGVPDKSRNKIAVNFAGYQFQMIQARTVRGGTGPGNFTAETILEAQQSADQLGFWTETDGNLMLNLSPYLKQLITTGRFKDKFSDEALPVAVGVTDREQRPRMVVFGDATFVSNIAALNAPYYDFVISSMEWLAERPANIGIKPKESSTFVLGSNVNYRGMILLPVGLMILAIVGVGSGIWVVRRR